MDDAQAVVEVCAIGSQIEKGLMEAEKATPAETPEEVEAALRAWVTTSSGGHDPEYQSALLGEMSRMPKVCDTPNFVCPNRVLSND